MKNIIVKDIDVNSLKEVLLLDYKIRKDTYVPLSANFTEEDFEPTAQRLEERVNFYKNKLIIEYWKGAYVSGKLIGNIRAKKIHGKAEIKWLFIDKDFRGMGIGSYLLKGSIDWLDSEIVYLKVLAFNKNAINYYFNLGFKISNELTNGLKINGKTEQMITMKLNINNLK